MTGSAAANLLIKSLGGPVAPSYFSPPSSSTNSNLGIIFLLLLLHSYSSALSFNLSHYTSFLFLPCTLCNAQLPVILRWLVDSYFSSSSGECLPLFLHLHQGHICTYLVLPAYIALIYHCCQHVLTPKHPFLIYPFLLHLLLLFALPANVSLKQVKPVQFCSANIFSP